MSTTSRLSFTKVLDYSSQTAVAQAFWVMAFAGVTAAGARLEIPHDPVPFTLQTFVVLLAGAFLGARNGAMSQLVYLAAGVLGAPVFAGGAFGLAKLVGPTGGYLLSFPLCAALVGYLTHRRKGLLWSFLSMALGLLVIFALGTVHLSVFYLHDAGTAFNAGFLIFSWWDMLKLSAAAMIYREIAKRWPRVPARTER